jgi:hypothetical protein
MRPNYRVVYADWGGESFPIGAFDYRQVAPQFLRQTVEYHGSEPAGTIIVDPITKHLYFTESPSRATRYGVGVGREGFGWSGEAHVNMKRNWPDWIPPREMIERSPEIVAQLERTSRGLGVPGGQRSPLGARAMYLFGDRSRLPHPRHDRTRNRWHECFVRLHQDDQSGHCACLHACGDRNAGYRPELIDQAFLEFLGVEFIAENGGGASVRVRKS